MYYGSPQTDGRARGFQFQQTGKIRRDGTIRPTGWDDQTAGMKGISPTCASAKGQFATIGPRKMRHMSQSRVTTPQVANAFMTVAPRDTLLPAITPWLWL